jgi:hypothetical protein
MTRYHVADAGSCEAVRQAINASWRNGPARHAEHYRDGVLVGREPLADWCARTGRALGEQGPVRPEHLIVSGADAVLELLEDGVHGALVSEQLGKGIVPRANQLARVTRAREHAQFAAGIRDALDDRYVEQVFADETLSDAQKREAITSELQNGARATSALTRKDSRAGARVIDGMLGGGKARPR